MWLCPTAAGHRVLEMIRLHICHDMTGMLRARPPRYKLDKFVFSQWSFPGCLTVTASTTTPPKKHFWFHDYEYLEGASPTRAHI